MSVRVEGSAGRCGGVSGNGACSRVRSAGCGDGGMCPRRWIRRPPWSSGEEEWTVSMAFLFSPFLGHHGRGISLPDKLK